MSVGKTPPSFTPALPRPHTYVPMLAWPDCYVCLKPRWHPIHNTDACLTPPKAANDGRQG